jgi:hypothetical protein
MESNVPAARAALFWRKVTPVARQLNVTFEMENLKSYMIYETTAIPKGTG